MYTHYQCTRCGHIIYEDKPCPRCGGRVQAVKISEKEKNEDEPQPGM